MRKIDDEADAKACLAAARAAGDDVAAWARAHGVDGRSLNAWKVNLGRRGSTTQRRGGRAVPTTLVEVVPARETRRDGRYVLELGGARLEFDDGCSIETLRRVLEAVRSC